MRNWTVIAVAALALGALSGVAAYQNAAPRAGDWHEIAWPFPRDGWPAGRAFRCDAGACGVRRALCAAEDRLLQLRHRRRR